MAYQNCPQRLHPIHWDPVTFIVSIIPKSCEVADVPHHSLGINKVPNTWPLILQTHKTRSLDMRPLLLPFVKRKLGSQSGVGFFAMVTSVFQDGGVASGSNSKFFRRLKKLVQYQAFLQRYGNPRNKEMFLRQLWWLWRLAVLLCRKPI